MMSDVLFGIMPGLFFLGGLMVSLVWLQVELRKRNVERKLTKECADYFEKLKRYQNGTRLIAPTPPEKIIPRKDSFPEPVGYDLSNDKNDVVFEQPNFSEPAKAMRPPPDTSWLTYDTIGRKAKMYKTPDVMTVNQIRELNNVLRKVAARGGAVVLPAGVTIDTPKVDSIDKNAKYLYSACDCKLCADTIKQLEYESKKLKRSVMDHTRDSQYHRVPPFEPKYENFPGLLD